MRSIWKSGGTARARAIAEMMTWRGARARVTADRAM
jgi:hypothetical protein